MLSRKEILQRYAYYYDELQKIGSFEVTSIVRYDDLKLPKGKVRKAYMEMKEIRFKGTIVDYLCWVSSNVILYFIREQSISSENEYNVTKNSSPIVAKRIKEVISIHKKEALGFARYLLNNGPSAVQLIKKWGFEDITKIATALTSLAADVIINKGKKIQ
jgi:hypothetical protein